MQTFLPDPDFAHVPGYGWRHHPAAKMWRGYEEALVAYGVAICDAWTALGHADTVRATLVGEFGREPGSQDQLEQLGLVPPWLGDEAFHRAHRSSLARKDAEWYRPLFPDVPDDLPYVWPDGPPPER